MLCPPFFPLLAAGLDPYNADTALDCATEIVSFTGSFHGRTMGSLALTYKVRGGGWGSVLCADPIPVHAQHEECFVGSRMHGRLIAPASPAVDSQDQYKTPFQPVMPGSVMVPYM